MKTRLLKTASEKLKHRIPNAEKVLPLASLFFLISIVYHVLHCIKITLVVKAVPDSGVEILPFLKIWVILPVSFLITWTYTKHAIKKSAQTVINFTLIIFIAFFILYVLLIYPNKELLFIDSLSEISNKKSLAGIKGLFNIIIYWPYIIFYVFAEMWSTLVVSILFWGLTNEISKTEEAKSYYSLITVGANIAGIVSGQMVAYLSLNKTFDFISYGKTAWDQSVLLILLLCLSLTIVIMKLFNYLCRMHGDSNKTLATKQKPPKQSGSIVKQWLTMPRYINLIAVMVLCYNIVYNLADLIWSNQCAIRFGDPSSLNAYLGHLDTLTGIASFFITILVFSPFIKKYGWTKTALLTPFVWLVCTLFLAFALYFNNFELDISGILLNLPILDLVIVAGTMQLCLGKACKYTVFDQTKEMAFIPLAQDDKRRYKAAIDGLFSRIGKSFSSLAVQFLLILTSGSLTAATPYAFVLICIMLLVWIYIVFKLGMEYKSTTRSQKNAVLDQQKDSIIAATAT